MKRYIGRTLAVLIASTGLLAVALAPQSGAAQTTISTNISYWDHSAPYQDTVIATQPALLKLLGATPTWIPIQASPPAIAAMKAGSFDFITGVGNPPVVSGIANGGDFKVVYLGSIDYVQLVVKAGIKNASDLAGKTIVDLIGSSEDYAFRGYLSTQHLTDKVNVLGLAGMETPVAAFKAGRIDGAYADYAQAAEMVKAGGHVLVDSVRIAKLGYAGINVSIVRGGFLRQHPSIVQGYVCAAVAATKLIENPNRAVRDAAFRASGTLTGQPADQAVASGEVGINGADVKLSDELSYFFGPHGQAATGGIVSNYVKTVRFLVANGKIHRTLTAQDILPHIDGSFVKKALNDGCPAS